MSNSFGNRSRFSLPVFFKLFFSSQIVVTNLSLFLPSQYLRASFSSSNIYSRSLLLSRLLLRYLFFLFSVMQSFDASLLNPKVYRKREKIISNFMKKCMPVDVCIKDIGSSDYSRPGYLFIFVDFMKSFL